MHNHIFFRFYFTTAADGPPRASVTAANRRQPRWGILSPLRGITATYGDVPLEAVAGFFPPQVWEFLRRSTAPGRYFGVEPAVIGADLNPFRAPAAPAFPLSLRFKR